MKSSVVVTKKALVCSDPDLVGFGVTAKVTDELDNEGIAWSLYDRIKPNPTIQNIKGWCCCFLRRLEPI